MTDKLITKLEALEAPDADIFQEVFKIAYPEPDGLFATDEKMLERNKWLVSTVVFVERLNCQAWESAAIMLVPDGWEWLRKSSETMSLYLPPTDNKTWAQHIDAAANHPAIALLICILKAKEPVE